MILSLSKYEIFKAVIESGSITKAAEKLHLTQSGVSYAVSSLETELGFFLLKRDRTGISLTSNGARILKHINNILQAEELLRREVTAITSIEAGIVRVGTLSSISMQWLPGILGEFYKNYPQIEVKTYLGCYDEMNEWIADGTVDFGFVSLPLSRAFEVIALKRDKLFVLLPASHPLGGEEAISLEQLEDEFFIMPQWGADDNIRRALNQSKVRLQVKYEIMEERTIFAMIQMGLGISILPELILVNVPDDIRIIPLANSDDRIIGMAAQSFKNLPPAAKKFTDTVQSWLKSQGIHDFPQKG